MKMKATKPYHFSFKREPMWIWIFSLGPAVVGVLAILIVLLIRGIASEVSLR
jgi:hypothetical protein